MFGDKCFEASHHLRLEVLSAEGVEDVLGCDATWTCR
jgi:hypothetical protein